MRFTEMYRIVKKEQITRTHLSYSEMELKCKDKCRNGKKNLINFNSLTFIERESK